MTELTALKENLKYQIDHLGNGNLEITYRALFNLIDAAERRSGVIPAGKMFTEKEMRAWAIFYLGEVMDQTRCQNFDDVFNSFLKTLDK